MFDILAKRGFAVEENPDQEILDLLRQSIAFDVEELVGIVEDMYAQPEKKPKLLEILRESRQQEQELESAHPKEYSARRETAAEHWQLACEHFAR